MKQLIFRSASGLLLIALLVTIFAGQKADAKKIKTEKYQAVNVACGETYKISRIAKEKTESDLEITLAKRIKGKNVKWSSSSKNLVVKKKTIRVKKPGNYRLIGRIKNKKLVLPVAAAAKYRSKDYSQASYVIIRSGNSGQWVKVENPEEVRALCERIGQSKYTFDYKGSQKNRIIGWVWSIQIYSADQVLLDGICTGSTYDGQFRYVCKYPDILRSYVEQLYNKYPKPAMP